LIRTDEQRVMQVLLGLQSNALKFTTEGRVTIIVEMRKIDDDIFLMISVQDTGIGIQEKD
jgi:signal transduction histidine kinase